MSSKRTLVKCAAVCLWMSSVSAFGNHCFASDIKSSSILEDTPQLGQTSYELEYNTLAGIQTEFVSQRGIRTESKVGGFLNIWDFKTGESHWLNPQTKIDLFHRGRPLVGKPRYYDGIRRLQKIGPCHYLNEVGTLWSRPGFGYATKEEACITDDGIILATINEGRATMTPIRLKRRDIPNELFQIPDGYRKIPD